MKKLLFLTIIFNLIKAEVTLVNNTKEQIHITYYDNKEIKTLPGIKKTEPLSRKLGLIGLARDQKDITLEPGFCWYTDKDFFKVYSKKTNTIFDIRIKKNKSKKIKLSQILSKNKLSEQIKKIKNINLNF